MTRVLIVAENASTQFGGEAILPWHYFRILRSRGVEAWLIVHERTRTELVALLPGEVDRMHFLPDTRLNKWAWKLGQKLPARIADMSLGYLSRLSTQLAARALARQLVRAHAIEVVHQPIPVSPREPSLLYRMGAPVIIGPMNGNMNFPPQFAAVQSAWVGGAVRLARTASTALHRLMPGKLRAAVLLVANERTRAALPSGARGRIITLVENGVDLALWSPTTEAALDQPIRFLFMGRLVDWKAADILLEAMARMDPALDARLEFIGDGPMRASLEALAARLGIADRVNFSGWQPQAECARRLRQSDALLLPSLYECGGAVVLEAMACALPVVATAWGGPADYLDDSCGILVPPSSRDTLIDGFQAAMSRLAREPQLRQRLGASGRQRAERDFDWDRKVDRMLTIYAAAQTAGASIRPEREG